MEKINSPCPAQELLKSLSGKFKAEIIQKIVASPARFSELMKAIPSANKQGIAMALKELESSEIIEKHVIQLKPLHINYSLTKKGLKVTTIFKEIEKMNTKTE